MSTPSIVDPEIITLESKSRLVKQAAGSVKWSILYNVVPRLVTPFSTMILAGLLTPADFGLVAISTFVLALARIVVDLGLGKTVVQRQGNVLEAASISLWINLAISFCLYGMLWAGAPWLAAAYANSRVADVIRLSAWVLPMMALQTVPKAMLQRNMQFRSLFWVNSSYLIIQSVAAVILAILSFGVWAIIWGQIIGLAASVGIAWRMARWRPSLVMDRSVVRPLLGFSVWIMASGFQNWLYLYADNAIAGLFLGVKSLGVYALGFNVATLVPTFLVAALGDVAYPTFCRLQKDRREVGLSLVKLQGLVATILLPLILGLSAVASPFIHLLYGNKWEGLGMVISILAIMPGLTPLWTLNQDAYQAIGKPSLWTKLSGISLLVAIPLLWIAAPYGLLVFVMVRFCGALFLPLGNIFVGVHSLGIGLRAQFSNLWFPLLTSIIMFVLVSILVRSWGPYESLLGWTKLFSIVLLGAGTYLALIWAFRRELWEQLYFNLHRIIS